MRAYWSANPDGTITVYRYEERLDVPVEILDRIRAGEPGYAARCYQEMCAAFDIDLAQAMRGPTTSRGGKASYPPRAEKASLPSASTTPVEEPAQVLFAA